VKGLVTPTTCGLRATSAKIFPAFAWVSGLVTPPAEVFPAALRALAELAPTLGDC